ncbi:MAG: cation:dicarboxylase symporter family transporter [Rhodobacteraceae bacterium]|nr:cation:dicarboxylase symporter family transporter [Paracoccaceae bacterium]
MRQKLLPLWVLFGATLGVVIGLYLPKTAALIDPVGDVYIRLMEVVVLPYLIASLMLGLGQISPDTARKLLRHSWVAYLLLWIVAFAVILTAGATAPEVTRSPVVNFASVPEAPRSFASLVDLVIPDNLFSALANNYIPAVVFVAIVFGVAIQHVEEKAVLITFLRVIHKACIKIWGWVVLIAPLGVCALVAGTIDRVNPEELLALSIYISVVISAALLLAFWIIPMLLTCFTAIGYWELLSALRGAFLIAFVTTLSVAALPIIQSAVETIAKRKFTTKDTAQQHEIIQTTLSVSYPLAQVGNFFVFVFLLYASYYFFTPIENSQMLALPGMTLLSGIGSPSSSIDAVSFLASWLNLPSLTTKLYVETMTITRYAQILASVSAFAFITALVTFNFYGHLTFRPYRLLLTAVGAAVCLVAILAVGRVGGTHIPLNSETNYQAMGLPQDLQALSDANLASRLGLDGTASDSGAQDPAPADGDVGILSRIQSSGVIRVGFNPEVLPFSYINTENRLVGYDVELMYRFARDMNVELEFVPYDWQTLIDDLEASKFDVAIGGIYITESRLQEVSASTPYFENPIALIVRADQVQDFASRDQVNEIANLTIAVFDDPVLLPLAKRSFPNATIKVLSNFHTLASEADIDAAIWTIEQARAWAISNEGYTAVVPKDLATRFLFGYLMPKQADALRLYLNYWLGLQTSNGTLNGMATRWIYPAIDQSSVAIPAP